MDIKSLVSPYTKIESISTWPTALIEENVFSSFFILSQYVFSLSSDDSDRSSILHFLIFSLRKDLN